MIINLDKNNPSHLKTAEVTATKAEIASGNHGHSMLTELSFCFCIFTDSRGSKYFVKFLGSIEVGFHKGNDVLCQAINKVCFHN